MSGGLRRSETQWIGGGQVKKKDILNQEWRKRGPRSSDDNIGRVVCARWGSCTRGALFAMHNFKTGIVDNAENANGCRFTFYVKLECTAFRKMRRNAAKFQGMLRILGNVEDA